MGILPESLFNDTANKLMQFRPGTSTDDMLRRLYGALCGNAGGLTAHSSDTSNPALQIAVMSSLWFIRVPSGVQHFWSDKIIRTSQQQQQQQQQQQLLLVLCIFGLVAPVGTYIHNRSKSEGRRPMHSSKWSKRLESRHCSTSSLGRRRRLGSGVGVGL